VLRREQVKKVLFEGKAAIVENGVAIDEDHAILGSLGVITGKNMRGDRHLPYWLEEGAESSLRDTEEDIPVISFTAMSSAQAQRSLGPSNIGSPIVLTPTEGSPAGPGIRGGGGKGPWTDLDKFYEEEDEEDDDDKSTDSKEEQDSDTGDGSEDGVEEEVAGNEDEEDEEGQEEDEEENDEDEGHDGEDLHHHP